MNNSFENPPVVKVGEDMMENFHVLKNLGNGSYSEVYQVIPTVEAKKSLNINTFVVIKKSVFSDASKKNDPVKIKTRRKHFEADCKFLYNLTHANIAQLFAAAVTRSRSTGYIIMEYYPGGDLYRYSKRHPLDGRQLGCIMKGVNSALKYMHERKMYHQDVKPQNILLDSRDSPVLTDFGLAGRLDKDHTTVKRWCTTRGFCAPEAFVPGPNCPFRMDMYSLGATMWQVVYKQHPKYHDDIFAFVLSCPRITPYFRKTLLNLLEPHPLSRWTAENFEEDFKRTQRCEDALGLVLKTEPAAAAAAAQQSTGAALDTIDQ